MATLALTNDQQELMAKEVTPLVDAANALVIKTQDQSNKAKEDLKEIKVRQKAFDAKFDPSVKAAHKAWKSAKELYNFFIDPFLEAEKIVKRKVVVFDDEQDRIREDKAREAEAKRQAAERKRQEELDRQAAAAEEKGQTERAEALREKKEEYVEPPVPVPPPAPTTKGTHIRKTWKGQVIDMKSLCKAIGEDKASPNMVQANQPAINAHAKANKETWAIPGIRFFEESDLSVRV